MKNAKLKIIKNIILLFYLPFLFVGNSLTIDGANFTWGIVIIKVVVFFLVYFPAVTLIFTFIDEYIRKNNK